MNHIRIETVNRLLFAAFYIPDGSVSKPTFMCKMHESDILVIAAYYICETIILANIKGSRIKDGLQ